MNNNQIPIKVEVIQDIPGCPKGRLFVLTSDLKFYVHVMTEKEYNDKHLQYYRLKIETIEQGLGIWFKTSS